MNDRIDNQQPTIKSATILGAGLMGRLLAWRLLNKGCQVILVEKSAFSAPRSAAHTAAAMISPMSEVVVSERAIYAMGRQSLRLWPQYLATLKRTRPGDIQYINNGSLVVAHPADESELEQFYLDLQHHLGSDNDAQWLNQRDLSSREPDIAAQFQRALYLPNEAYLDNRHLLDTLLTDIIKLGGRCVDNTQIDFSASPAEIEKYRTLFNSDVIIDCRGLGSQDLNDQLRGVRGEVVWVTTPEVTLRHPIRLMHPRYKLYIVPKPGHKFIIGATEIESQDASPVSVQSILELCSALYTLNPAFSEARILEMDANLRPSLWDNLPKIADNTLSLAGQQKRVISINGLYRHGYLLAPYLTEKTVNQFLFPNSTPEYEFTLL